jgi:hypothetical protein
MTTDSFVRTIIEDPDHPGELLLDLGDELCKKMGWWPGDHLEWTDNGNDSWTLKKIVPQPTENYKKT